jgi:hypothetical protein
MSKIREQRLAEFYSQDEGLDAGGTKTPEPGDSYKTEKSEVFLDVTGTSSSRKSPSQVSVEVKMNIIDDRAVTDSIIAQNVRLGGITMRTPSPGMCDVDLQENPDTAQQIIKQRMQKISAVRSQRYQDVLSNLQDFDSSDHEKVY